MLSIQQALQHIIQRVEPLDHERVYLVDAISRTLAQPLCAQRQAPSWDNSAMDGYAVRASDVPTPNLSLPVSDTVAAGDAGDRPIAAGHAARIFTGAPMPPGTDTVIIQENTTALADGRVTFHQAAAAGANVRRAGSDMQPGDLLLPVGRKLTPFDLNCMASQGYSSALVYRRPRVAIFSTGSELCEVDGPPPGPGQIVNSNVLALAAAVKAAGALPTVLPIVIDDRQATQDTLASAISSDVVIACGGMSVGDYDFMRHCLRDITADGFAFWKVAIKPGKPLGFGYAGRCAIFGLPGNPASAMVTFEVFVRPALRRMMGQSKVIPRQQKARLVTPLSAGRGRTNYLRASITRIDGDTLWVDAKRNQSSGSLGGLAAADALVIVPANAAAKEAGDWVQVHLLGEPLTELEAEQP